MQLTTEQRAVADAVMDAYENGVEQQTVGGLAGTGKTVLVRALRDEIGTGACVIAPTGKAAMVLRNKGIQAETIHSVIYLFSGVTQARDEQGVAIENAKPCFDNKNDLRDSRPDVFIVDESSMVNDVLYNDLRSHGVPMIFVGDHGQLPPVGGDPRLMHDPQHVLTTIHRQAAESPIIRIAHKVRNGETFDDQTGDIEPGLAIYNNADVDKIVKYAVKNDVDQILCAFNQTRHAINHEYRRVLNMQGVLDVGDKVLCTRNNRRKMIFNGMVFTIKSINSQDAATITADIEDDAGNMRHDIVMDAGAFGVDIYDEAKRPKGADVFDYAYAMTVHKSQGSEWKHVLVVDQPCSKWDMRRWRYTAFTRAKERLVILRSNGRRS